MKYLSQYNNFEVIQESYYRGEFESSIKQEDAEELVSQIAQYQNLLQDILNDNEGNQKLDNIIAGCENRLYIYDTINKEFVLETLFSNPVNSYTYQEIIKMGDKIMDKYGTEPHMIEQAFEDCFSVLTANGIIVDEEEEEVLEERVKSQRYKGHKIPGKYLTKNPGKMKKEIDRFRGKKEYKKDWDADYTSGKGGEGKRVKTKKSAATKAYHKMFGDK